jgi:hypothetical protein
VNAAINRKIEQYYLVQEYAFRVEREKKESERKQIEANGIRDFQQTVSQGISDSYVRWRGIEATLQLAQSPNTKIVIIGSGKDGLPVILGNVDTPIAPATPKPAIVPDNSEAAKDRPAAATPPMLEKTPASNLPTPPERPSPTAVPRAPSDKPPSTSGSQPDGATPAAPGKQSAAPPGTQTTWPLALSDVQNYIANLMRSEKPSSRPPETNGAPGGMPPMRPTPGQHPPGTGAAADGSPHGAPGPTGQRAPEGPAPRH